MIEINKCKLVPGITATWGDVTGNIENQSDLVQYISTHGGGNAEWGSITGVLSDQTDLMNYMSSFATQAWVSSQGYITEHQDLSSYATKSWVSDQNYLTATALSGYATESWVASQGYLVSDDLSQYATRQWVTGRGYISSADLSGYATESWVTSQGYITSQALSGYATESWVSSQNYLSSTALTGYATESWVSSQNYLSSGALSGYATQSYVASAISSSLSGTVQYTLDESLLNEAGWDVLKRPMDQNGSTKSLVLGYGKDGSDNNYWGVGWKDDIQQLGYFQLEWQQDEENPEGILAVDKFYPYVIDDPVSPPLRVYNLGGEVEGGWIELPEGWEGPMETIDMEYSINPLFIGQYTWGDIDDVPTLSFNGARINEEGAAQYTYLPHWNEDDQMIEYVESVEPYALDSDLSALGNRVTALETNYGNAVAQTNNILGV